MSDLPWRLDVVLVLGVLWPGSMFGILLLREGLRRLSYRAADRVVGGRRG